MRRLRNVLCKAALCAAFFVLPGAPAPAGSAQDQALIASAERGDVRSLRKLLREGASVQARDNRGRTALLAATHANRVEAARLLIAAGADVNAKDALADSPFLYAGAEGRNEILKMTLRRGRSCQHQPLRRHRADSGRPSRPCRDGEDPAHHPD
jgi:uncharacterized protein